MPRNARNYHHVDVTLMSARLLRTKRTLQPLTLRVHWYTVPPVCRGVSYQVVVLNALGGVVIDRPLGNATSATRTDFRNKLVTHKSAIRI